jgi:hypothetical protein
VVTRAVMTMLVVAVAVRLIFIVLAPIALYLALAVIAFAGFRIVSWWRSRW